MKKSFLFVCIGCLFTLFASPVIAQKGCSGIYLTAEDFLAGKLCSASAGRNKSTTTGYDLLSCRHLFVEQAGVTREMSQKDIYAVKCCDGNVVRIYHGDSYTLLNPGGNIPMYRVRVNSVGKGDVVRMKYYFSKDAASDIADLTTDNLKTAFPDNLKFDDALDAEFRSDRDLSGYDKAHQCYKLDRVYAASKK